MPKRNPDDIKGYGTPSEKKPTVYREGRTCRFPGCNTKLSIYTEGNKCSLHKKLETDRRIKGLRSIRPGKRVVF